MRSEARIGDEPELPAFRAGAVIGRYRLVRRLALGGMAELFLARVVGIEGFEKPVVVKRMLAQFAARDEFVRMFLDEARLAGMLDHPNVAQVYDIGREAGEPFFTMEYVHGRSLESLVEAATARGEGMPLEHAVAIVQGVAAGLHHAHERCGPDGRALGIVHRDVSPSNVLVTFDGTIKVVDFGIAKAANRRSATRAGEVKGKTSYMAPEQCRGQDLDRRSDVFAIGILLYELTTGTRLFGDEGEYDVLNRIVTKDAPPPSRGRPEYPRALEAIVLRALKRVREERYSTAQELQIDLERFVRDARLVVSPVELGRYMEELFGPPGDVWGEEVGAGETVAVPGAGTKELEGRWNAPAAPGAALGIRGGSTAGDGRRRALVVAGSAAVLAIGALILGGSPSPVAAPSPLLAPFSVAVPGTTRPKPAPRATVRPKLPGPAATSILTSSPGMPRIEPQSRARPARAPKRAVRARGPEPAARPAPVDLDAPLRH